VSIARKMAGLTDHDSRPLTLTGRDMIGTAVRLSHDPVKKTTTAVI
jgi:hypothetical protein